MQTFFMTNITDIFIASLVALLISAYLWMERSLRKSLPVEVIDHIPAEPKEEMIVPEIITPDLMSNVSDEEIEAVFKNTNFVVNHRGFLTKSVLKIAVGYDCGNTITCIMRSLGLIGQYRQGRLPVLTKKGQEYLQTALHKQL